MTPDDPSATSPGVQAGRLGWLDASRFFAALGVIMIHCSSDAGGNAFGAYPVGQRVVPVIARMFGELSGAELFVVFSMFVLAMKVAKPNAASFGPTMRLQARRLLIPFAVWSLFYLAFRFAKAGAFGYSGALLGEIEDWRSWVQYALLGSAQYHLHFLPTLFGVMLFYPIIMVAIRFPMIGLSLVPLLYCMDTMQERIWALVADPMSRELLARAVKIICFSGYGFAAFSLFGIWRRGIAAPDARLLLRFAICVCVIAFLTNLAYASNVIMSGMWGARPGAAFYAHYLLPVLIFLGFVAAQNVRWSPSYAYLATLNFGIYLIHPVFIDVYDIAVARAGLQLDPSVMVISKYILVAICAIAATALLAKVRLLSWTIGISPASRAGRAPALATGAPT